MIVQVKNGSTLYPLNNFCRVLFVIILSITLTQTDKCFNIIMYKNLYLSTHSLYEVIYVYVYK